MSDVIWKYALKKTQIGLE